MDSSTETALRMIVSALESLASHDLGEHEAEPRLEFMSSGEYAFDLTLINSICSLHVIHLAAARKPLMIS